MAPCPLFCDKALRCVLRTQVAHLKLYVRVSLFKSIAEIAGNLSAPGMDESELTFFARAFLQSLGPLIGLELRQFRIELLSRSLSCGGVKSFSGACQNHCNRNNANHGSKELVHMSLLPKIVNFPSV